MEGLDTLEGPASPDNKTPEKFSLWPVRAHPIAVDRTVAKKDKKLVVKEDRQYLTPRS